MDLRPVRSGLLGALLIISSTAVAQAPDIEKYSSERSYNLAAAYTDRKFLSEIVGPLDAKKRTLFASTTFTVARRKDGLPPACILPENLAYSDYAPEGSTITICSNNLAYVQLAFEEYLLMDMIDRRITLAARDDGSLLSQQFMLYMAGIVQRNRNVMGNYEKIFQIPCGAVIFFYLNRDNPDQIRRCIPGETPAGFEFDEALRSLANHQLIDAIPREDLANRDDAIAYIKTRVAEARDESFTLLMNYVILHELGHIFSGDLSIVSDDMCRNQKLEKKADDFALARMRKLTGIEPGELLLSQMGWIQFTLYLNETRKRDPDSFSMPEGRQRILISRAHQAFNLITRILDEKGPEGQAMVALIGEQSAQELRMAEDEMIANLECFA